MTTPQVHQMLPTGYVPMPPIAVASPTGISGSNSVALNNAMQHVSHVLTWTQGDMRPPLLPRGYEARTTLQPAINDLVVGDRYIVKHHIGRGSFGEIYCGLDCQTGEPVAIKVESITSKYPQLVFEYQVYMAMKNGPGVPNVRWYGQSGTNNVLVMDLLGDSLEALYNKCNRRFSLKTVLMLAIQMLDRIQFQHECNYLHRDIKPDNFLMGVAPNQHIVYLIDMGLSKCYRDPTTHEHMPYREKKRLTGTPRYASINTHRGREQCRRDDLESMGYMLLYFLLGRLPWQGLKARSKQEKYDKIGNKKINTPIDELCMGQPKEFADYLKYCRSLGYEQDPDYKYLRTLFVNLFVRRGFTEDWCFDWIKLPEYQSVLGMHNFPLQMYRHSQKVQMMLSPGLHVNVNAVPITAPAQESATTPAKSQTPSHTQPGLSVSSNGAGLYETHSIMPSTQMGAASASTNLPPQSNSAPPPKKFQVQAGPNTQNYKPSNAAGTKPSYIFVGAPHAGSDMNATRPSLSNLQSSPPAPTSAQNANLYSSASFAPSTSTAAAQQGTSTPANGKPSRLEATASSSGNPRVQYVSIPPPGASPRNAQTQRTPSATWQQQPQSQPPQQQAQQQHTSPTQQSGSPTPVGQRYFHQGQQQPQQQQQPLQPANSSFVKIPSYYSTGVKQQRQQPSPSPAVGTPAPRVASGHIAAAAALAQSASSGGKGADASFYAYLEALDHIEAEREHWRGRCEEAEQLFAHYFDIWREARSYLLQNHPQAPLKSLREEHPLPSWAINRQNGGAQAPVASRLASSSSAPTYSAAPTGAAFARPSVYPAGFPQKAQPAAQTVGRAAAQPGGPRAPVTRPWAELPMDNQQYGAHPQASGFHAAAAADGAELYLDDADPSGAAAVRQSERLKRRASNGDSESPAPRVEDDEIPAPKRLARRAVSTEMQTGGSDFVFTKLEEIPADSYGNSAAAAAAAPPLVKQEPNGMMPQHPNPSSGMLFSRLPPFEFQSADFAAMGDSNDSSPVPRDSDAEDAQARLQGRSGGKGSRKTPRAGGVGVTGGKFKRSVST